ncbi:MAG: type II toxin-antitoxin system HicA family toxin [bacterium]
MKRKELVRRLEQEGCVFVRHGSNHDLYRNPTTNLKQPIPRHTEIHDLLARHIWNA